MANVEQRIGILIDGTLIRLVDLLIRGKKVEVQKTISLTASSSDDSGLAAAIKKGVEELGCEGKIACLTVSDRSIGFELVFLPKMKPTDLKKVISRHAVRIGNTAREGGVDIQYSSRVTREVHKGETLQDEYQILAGAGAAVERYIQLAEQCGLRIESLVAFPEGLCSGLRAVLPSDAQEGMLLVDFGISFTSLVLAAGKHWVYHRILNKGIEEKHAFSAEELRTGLEKVPEESAETFVVEEEPSTTPPPAPGIPAGEESVVHRILVSELRRTVLYLEREHSVRIQKIAFSGVLKPQEGLLEDLREKIGKPTEWAADPRIQCSGPIGPYLSTIGAVFAAAEPQPLNLVPPSLRPRRGVSPLRTIAASLSLFVMVALGGWTYFTHQAIGEMRKQITLSKPLVDIAITNRTKDEDELIPEEIKPHVDALLQLQKHQSPIPFFLEVLSYQALPNVELHDIFLSQIGEQWQVRAYGGIHARFQANAVEEYGKFIRSLETSPLTDYIESNPVEADPLAAKKEERTWGAGFPFQIFMILKDISK